MFLVSAVIKPHRLDEVRQALVDLGVAGMTVSEVRGFGRQRGHTETYRGTEYQVDLIPKLKVEVVVEAVLVEDAIKAIIEAARTGQIGDGKIWVSAVEAAVRIRTGERDREAL